MNLDALREDLTDLAGRVTIVDLRDRSLAQSRQLARRRVAAAVVALLVVIGAAALAVRPGRTVGPPLPAPTPLPTTTAEPQDPVQRGVSAGVLAGATLDLPAWAGTDACSPGPADFVGSSHLFPNRVGNPQAIFVSRSDVTVDGQLAVAAALLCRRGTDHWYQVAVFQPHKDGTVSTVAQVLADAAVVFAVSSPGPDQVAVELGDAYPAGSLYSDVERTAQHQVRTYRWNGSSFVQSAGPTSFPVDPPRIRLDLRVYGDLVLTHGVGRLSIEVRNDGPIVAPRVSVTITVPAALRATGPDWSACRMYPPAPDSPSGFVCDVGQLVPGAAVSRSYQFVVVGQASTDGQCSVSVLQRPPYVPEQLDPSHRSREVAVIVR